MIAKTISVCLQKGGTGKSTTSQNLSAILGYKGYKVLLVDCDSQANATLASGITDPDRTLSDVLAGDCGITDAIIPLSLFYDLLPADIMLTNFESVDYPSDSLHLALDAVRDRYDFIVLDSPPSLGNLLKNVLFASDDVVIPLDPRPFSIHGIDDLRETLEAVQAATGRAKVLGLLLVRYTARTVLCRNVDSIASDIAEDMGTSVFATRIRESVTVGEAQSYGRPLIEYAPKAPVTADYIDFTDEVLERMGR